MPGVTTAYQNGVHGSRPAASSGCILYACSTHSLIYRSDGSAWATWMTIGSTSTTVASDTIWTAAGQLALSTGSAAASALSIGAAGKVLQSNGTTASWVYPPGYEFDYAQLTTNVNVSATAEASATTILTGNAVTYDGSQIILIEFFAPNSSYAENDNSRFWLYDGSSSIGEIRRTTEVPASHTIQDSVYIARRLTPSNASHTYGIRGTTGGAGFSVTGGSGGSGNYVPAFLRITKVSGGA